MQPKLRIPDGMEPTQYLKSSECRLFGNPPVSIEGDFDGDGAMDRAMILKKKGKNEEGLYVFLSSSSKFKLLEKISGTDFNSMSISLQAKGTKVDSACKRGYEELCDGSPKEVGLETDGLWFVQCSAAASIFYWDKKTQDFLRLWYSD